MKNAANVKLRVTQNTRDVLIGMGNGRWGAITLQIERALTYYVRHVMAADKMYPMTIQPVKIKTLDEMVKFYLAWQSAIAGEPGYFLKKHANGTFLLFKKDA